MKAQDRCSHVFKRGQSAGEQCVRLVGSVKCAKGSHQSPSMRDKNRAETLRITRELMAIESVCNSKGCMETSFIGAISCPACLSARNLARYYRIRAELIEQMGGRCVRCGATDQLEFDHIDWRLKTANVGHLIPNGAPEEVLQAEIAKCQLLCQSCHLTKSVRDRAERRAEQGAEKAA